MDRVSLGDITNMHERPIIDITFPSTSTGESSFQVPKAITQKPKATPNKNCLIKTIKKLQLKNSKYAARLKKAMRLSENKSFKNSLKHYTTLAALFTVMQFREAKRTKMGRRFTEAEKIMALSLYKRSPKAYRWLQKIFVLPSSMTLSRVIARANLRAGINENLFKQLKERVQKMQNDDKLCILIFDEMSIAPHFDFNLRKDEISGFIHNGSVKGNKLADHALVFMVRGIQKKLQATCSIHFLRRLHKCS